LLYKLQRRDRSVVDLRSCPATIFEQPDAASVRVQHAQVVIALEAKFPAAAAHLDEARDDILAFTAFPARSGGRSGATTPRSG
jgi:transposase-like protein